MAAFTLTPPCCSAVNMARFDESTQEQAAPSMPADFMSSTYAVKSTPPNGTVRFVYAISSPAVSTEDLSCLMLAVDDGDDPYARPAILVTPACFRNCP